MWSRPVPYVSWRTKRSPVPSRLVKNVPSCGRMITPGNSDWLPLRNVPVFQRLSRFAIAPSMVAACTLFCPMGSSLLPTKGFPSTAACVSYSTIERQEGHYIDQEIFQRGRETDPPPPPLQQDYAAGNAEMNIHSLKTKGVVRKMKRQHRL